MQGSYQQISLTERRQISSLLDQKKTVSEIARQLGRHRSTIYREINRNTYRDDDPFISGYFPMNAQEFAHRRRQKLRKLECDQNLKDYVICKLKEYWSPEQIAGYLKHIGYNGLYACHETIYRFIYSLEGKALGLYQYLFRAKKNRSKRFERVPHHLRGIPENLLIQNRPVHIGARIEFGHWEADLMMFKKEHGKANITTLTERKSRYSFLIKNETKHSKAVMGSIRESLIKLPKPVRKTVTFDRGSEFLAYPLLSRHINVTSYYCEPRSPWQKGTVENTNGRIRRFLPRDTALKNISDK